jgi:CDP-diacylglycerol---glycerol-3-phosphate 3-phosphatidyltransferase
MITLSNILSIARAPLALLFLIDNIPIRITSVILAMITDSIDGYFARKTKTASKFGAILDPAMDKFYVYFVLAILIIEGKMKVWKSLAMISRDFAVLIFSIYLLITKRHKSYELRAIRWGKVTTAMQFITIIAIASGYFFSWHIFVLFIIFGILSFIELFQTKPSKTISH